MAELDVQLFWKRLSKLHSHFLKNNETAWNGADCLLFHRGPLNEDDPYQKSALFHQWIFGYELIDTILLVRKDGQVWFMGSKKKCDFVQSALRSRPATKSSIQNVQLLVRNKEDKDSTVHYDTLWNEVQAARISNGDKRVVGLLIKERDSNVAAKAGLLSFWENKLTQEAAAGHIRLADIALGLSFAMAVKDETELDLIKKSSVLSNKVMKHGFTKRMEEVIESEEAITHEALATLVDEIIEDPSKINLKVPKEDVQSCYFPIVQSGGSYDLRVSAQSSTNRLSHDVILASLGARYKNYCSTIARTFFVDPPKRVAETYDVLLEMQDACLAVMRPGNPLRAVYKAAVQFLQERPPTGTWAYLVDHLPKNLGFATGLDFRESALLLTPKNAAVFKTSMVFSLSVGFQNLTLSEADRAQTPDKSPVKKLSSFALLISDIVRITNETADVMTKMGKNFTDVAYNTNEDAGSGNGDDDNDDDDDDDDDVVVVPDAPEGDEALARKLSKDRRGVRTSSRLSAKDQSAQTDALEGAAERERKQIQLMQRRNEERLRELASNSKRKGGEDGKDQADELETYKRTRDYPDSIQPNQVKVDMANQCVFLPICGDPVPFHISTIKNVVMPDADNGTLLRINFYSAGMAIGKDAPANMVKLVLKYAPYASFIREMTFRSLDTHNLTLAFRQISELRKRARQRELREQEEATLVEQEKLVRTKNERVPRLSDLTMRPVFYQPCENDIMVLIHFHLKNPIMIGKKKHKDVQFFTEVVEASQAVDNARRSMYDPDEMDDEQRERQLRKKLNQAFKEFCKKVDAVAKKNGYELEFDIPYRDLGFQGNPHKEMVQIMPTLNCLVSLTETPFFVVDLDEVDHVHFERVTYMSKAFDIVLVNKDFNKMPWRIDMIPSGDKEAIQEWLTDMEITYTEGPMNLNWKQIINTVKDDDRFYMNTEEDEVTEKEAGWEFLRLYGKDDDEEQVEEEDDSEFSEGREEEEEEEEEEEDDEAFDSELDEDDEEEDFDADDDLEEQGLDWDEMEAQAQIDDRRKRSRDEDDDGDDRKPKRSNARGGGGGGGGGGGRAGSSSGGGGRASGSGGGGRAGNAGNSSGGGGGRAGSNRGAVPGGKRR